MTVAQLGKGLDPAQQEDRDAWQAVTEEPQVRPVSQTPVAHHTCILVPSEPLLSHAWRTTPGPAGFHSHGRKACLSTVEEPSLVCQKLQAHIMWEPGGSAGLPGQILPISFC